MEFLSFIFMVLMYFQFIFGSLMKLCIIFRRLHIHNPTGLMVRRLAMSNCAIIVVPLDSYLPTLKASLDTHLNPQETRNYIILNINIILVFVNKVLLAMLLTLSMFLEGFLTDFNAWNLRRDKCRVRQQHWGRPTSFGRPKWTS